MQDDQPTPQQASGDNTLSISAEKLAEFEKAIARKEDLQSLIADLAAGDTSALLEALLGAALTLRASDLHVEPLQEGATVRLRIDGILHEAATLDVHLYSLLLSRIKLLSRLKLNIHAVAQEGRFSVVFPDRTIEIRVSLLPSQYGEDVAMRILDPHFLISFEKLGFRSDLQDAIAKELKKPQGLFLVTGPTGSGKTTTLYAFMRALQSPEIKIVTLEDPIEYHLRGMSQTQIDEAKGYTFADGLKAILRQDPDAVLLGELRAADAADAALHASLAGRKVFSTLHTNDAAGAVPRLVDMGIDPATISSGLSSVIAQRLVRRLCPDCKQERVLTAAEQDAITKILGTLPASLAPTLSSPISVFSPGQGCDSCAMEGYRGRMGVFEFLPITAQMREHIMSAPPEDELRAIAQKEGMITMQQDALLRVLEGVTSLEEVARVLGPVV